MCKSCYMKLKKLSDALKGVEYIRSRIKELFTLKVSHKSTEQQQQNALESLAKAKRLNIYNDFISS